MNMNLTKHFRPIRTPATLTRKSKSFWLAGFLIAGIGIFDGGAGQRAAKKRQ